MSGVVRKAASLPPLRKQEPSYIEKSMALLEAGCHQDESLKIDGFYGDYRMKLFRLKDKNHYANNIKSIFTNTFRESLIPEESPDEGVRGQIEEIVKSERHREQY